MQSLYLYSLLLVLALIIVLVSVSSTRASSAPSSTPAPPLEAPAALRGPASGSRRALVVGASPQLIAWLTAKQFQVQNLSEYNATLVRAFCSSLRPGDMGVLWGEIELGAVASVQGSRLLVGVDSGELECPLDSATIQVRTSLKDVGVIPPTDGEVLMLTTDTAGALTSAFCEVLRRYPFTFNVSLSGMVLAMRSLLSNAACPGSVSLALGKPLSLSSSLSAWGL